MSVTTRKKAVDTQLAWLESRGIVYLAGATEHGQYRIITHEKGPVLEVSLSGAEAFVSGAMTVHSWMTRAGSGANL